MIKNFVSDALLSVFMDKKARQKLKTSRKAKAARAPAKGADKPVGDGPDAPPTPAAADPMETMGQDEVTALIRESLNAAEQEISDKKNKRAANPSRQALIDKALAIHSSKQHIVDDLPEEQREKLLFMAQQALGEQLKGKK